MPASVRAVSVMERTIRDWGAGMAVGAVAAAAETSGVSVRRVRPACSDSVMEQVKGKQKEKRRV